MRQLRRTILCLFICATASASQAQAQVAQRVSSAFANWAYDVGAQNAVMTLWHNGKLHQNVVIGEGASDRPVELASLSKAITAVCVAQMIADGIWQAKTTSFDVLGYGAPNITVAQLLTHSSGLGPDETQVLMTIWFGVENDLSEVATKHALLRKQQKAVRGRYAYNNENYAVLGEMITRQTGQSYARYCKTRVLDPAGVTSARPSAKTASYLPFGGWQMSVQDYAAFMWRGFGPGGVVGLHTNRWPRVQVQAPTEYGMGMFQRLVGGKPNFWHFGALCLPGRMNIGSYGVIWQGEWQIVAAYDVCPTWPQMADLDRAMGAAVFAQ